MSFLPSATDGSSRQESSKDIVDLNSIINQLNITDIYKTIHLTIAEYTFFSSLHVTFIKTDHILGHKIHLKRKTKES